MRHISGSGRGRDAQTFVFFALTFGTIILLCGLAIDSGLLFLAKARMSRAMDGAALAAVGNFNTSPDPDTNRMNVAIIMRNFAVANFTDLGLAHNVHTTNLGSAHYQTPADFPISSTATVDPETSNGITTYTFNFNDTTKDPNGAYRKYVQVIETTGAGGQITSATCSARCPVGTYFIGAIGPFFRDLKVSSSAVATRNPRLIMIVLDRSASMLQPGGGAYGLPQAVVQFLDFFDTSADYIGIVSFGSNARLEMPMTTNFLVAGTNLLYDAYDTNLAGGVLVGTPGVDPEEFASNYPSNPEIPENYATSGVRRLKFGGSTAADDGIRLGMEQLMANPGFNNPDVVKYLVIFTDGAWNQARTLFAAPPYTNIVFGPLLTAINKGDVVTNTAIWGNDLAADAGIVPVPTLSPLPGVTNAIAAPPQFNGTLAAPILWGRFENLAPDHVNDSWSSMDGTNEPINVPEGGFVRKEGDTMSVTNFSILDTNTTHFPNTPIYARYIDVWLPPGSVDYEYTNASSGPQLVSTYVSDMNNPTNHIQIQQLNGQFNELVVPGYVADGLFFDGLDFPYYDNSFPGYDSYPSYRINNFHEYYMWPDDQNAPTTLAQQLAYTNTASLERQLMFRNYANLLTGFYITRADDPPGPAGDTNSLTGATNPAYGLGPYYPGAGVYWPFDMVGWDYDPTFSLTNASLSDPDGQQNIALNGGSRHGEYTINMQSSNAAPRWSGEWFFAGTGGVNVLSTTNNVIASSLITNQATWLQGAPTWLSADFNAAGETIMTNESAHNTNVIPTADVWHPFSYSGTFIGTAANTNAVATLVANNPSTTGGYIVDWSSGTGKVYKDSMAYSGRPTHFYDFSQSKWIPFLDQHLPLNIMAQPLGFWKAQEYAYHARSMGVTIYTVGYGTKVKASQQLILAQIANATNSTSGNPQPSGNPVSTTYQDLGGTNIPYNRSQAIGREFYATDSADISNDFFQVGTAINAALTQ